MNQRDKESVKATGTVAISQIAKVFEPNDSASGCDVKGFHYHSRLRCDEWVKALAKSFRPVARELAAPSGAGPVAESNGAQRRFPLVASEASGYLTPPASAARPRHFISCREGPRAMARSRDRAIRSVVECVADLRTVPGHEIEITWPRCFLLALVIVTSGTARGQHHAAPLAPSLRAQLETPAGSDVTFGEADTAALRAETIDRLKGYDSGKATTGTNPTSFGTTDPGSASQSPPPSTAVDSPVFSPSSGNRVIANSVPALLHERLRWLAEYDAACAALQKATHPEPSPSQQLEEARAEIAHVRTILSQADQKPEGLLPKQFRGKAVDVSSTLGSEMKDAIEATTNELKDWKNKLEGLRGEVARLNSLSNAKRSERDTLFQRVTALNAKGEEHESAVTDALSTGERRLAHERLVNFEWELRVESLRLRLIEAQIAVETKLAEVRERKLELYHAHVELASRTLEPMKARYRVVADEEERDLTQAKVREENRARLSTDPLDQFRARRTADLLALEALVIKNEQTLVITPSPSYEEQRTLADRADFDFANIKELLDDGKVSRLDAIRLNNEFRRIGPERDGLLKKEMSQVEAQLQYYENTLTSVELELLQNSLHDRWERDLLRERLSPERWSEGESLIRELENKNRSLLLRRRRALEKLTEATSHTLVQIIRRLGILEQEYVFIRSNIFWVRDQEPIGLVTLTQGAREFNVLIKGLLRLIQETLTPSLWGQPSGEFVITAAAVFVCPIALVRLRRILGKQGKRDRPLTAE
jgi:hypothetical protein